MSRDFYQSFLGNIFKEIRTNKNQYTVLFMRNRQSASTDLVLKIGKVRLSYRKPIGKKLFTIY
jgi:hypothetical protein